MVSWRNLRCLTGCSDLSELLQPIAQFHLMQHHLTYCLSGRKSGCAHCVNLIQPELAMFQSIDATGRFVIPGLMNANVHLLWYCRIETLARYQHRLSHRVRESTHDTDIVDRRAPDARTISVAGQAD